MSDIKNLDEVRRNKRARKRSNRVRDSNTTKKIRSDTRISRRHD